LTHHLSTAAEVARLRATIEDESEDEAGSSSSVRELERRLRLTYDGRAIRWSEFFYRQDRLEELFERLHERRVEHPVAFEFTAVQRFPIDGPPYNAIRGVKAANTARSKLPLTSWLDITLGQIAVRIPDRQPIIVVGMPTAAIRGQYRNLRLDVHRTSQIALR
jgi:hypothetical protein